MAALPYMQFEVSRYLADTAHLTTEEHGAYLLLIFNYWLRGKPLPDSDDRLANIAKLSNERWTDVRQTLNEFFEVVDGCWIHKRIERDLQRTQAKVEKAKRAGIESGKSRKQSTSNGRSTDVQQPIEQTLNQKKRKEEKRIEEKRREETKAASAFELPDYVDQKTWEDWVAMRKRIRNAPFTDRAQNGIISDLAKLKAMGIDPNRRLEEGIKRGWRGVLFDSDTAKNGNGHANMFTVEARPNRYKSLDELEAQ